MGALKRFSLAILVTLACTTAQATGIPVLDIANLIQTVQQVMDDITAIENQVEQIEQLRNQLDSMTGSRNLGSILNSPSLQNYIPSNAYRALDSVDASGYAGLTGTAKSLRDAGMAYNCMDRTGASRTSCQARLAQPYQQKGLLQDAMNAASGRLTQITSLMRQISATGDQKAVLEIQARIGAENAMLTHELTQIQMLQAMADSEERIARSRDRERQNEMLSRTGHISDHLP